MTDLFKAKAALYAALVDAPIDVSLLPHNLRCMQALTNDPEGADIITEWLKAEGVNS